MKKIIVLMGMIFLALIVGSFVGADIAPQPGYHSVNVNNKIININDYPDYYFIVFAEGPSSTGPIGKDINFVKSDGTFETIYYKFAQVNVYAVKKSDFESDKLQNMTYEDLLAYLNSTKAQKVLSNIEHYKEDKIEVKEKNNTYTINIDKACAKEGEKVYDISSKGPTSCCVGLVLKECEGVCTPSILGACAKNETDETYCEKDEDCGIGKLECCHDCGKADYSLTKYLSLNNKGYDNWRTKNCANVLCPHCAEESNPDNEKWVSKCIDNKCEKVNKKNCSEGTTDEDGTCFKNLSNGRKAEIKIMPETASEKAIERLGELGFTIELKEVGKGDAVDNCNGLAEEECKNNFECTPVYEKCPALGDCTQTMPFVECTHHNIRLVYELSGNKEGKFLGIFKIMAKVKAQVDAETGEVKVIKPWWSFLATNI